MGAIKSEPLVRPEGRTQSTEDDHAAPVPFSGSSPSHLTVCCCRVLRKSQRSSNWANESLYFCFLHQVRDTTIQSADVTSHHKPSSRFPRTGPVPPDGTKAPLSATSPPKGSYLSVRNNTVRRRGKGLPSTALSDHTSSSARVRHALSH